MKLPVLLYIAVNARQRRKKENIHCAVFHSLQFWCDLEKWSQLPTEYEPLMLHTGYNKRNFTLLRISLQLCPKRYHHFVKMWKYLSLTEFQIYRNIFPQRMTTSALIPLITPPPPQISPQPYRNDSLWMKLASPHRGHDSTSPASQWRQHAFWWSVPSGRWTGWSGSCLSQPGTATCWTCCKLRGWLPPLGEQAHSLTVVKNNLHAVFITINVRYILISHGSIMT